MPHKISNKAQSIIQYMLLIAVMTGLILTLYKHIQEGTEVNINQTLDIFDDKVTCGDGTCEGDENCENCPEDCGCSEGEACVGGVCVSDCEPYENCAEAGIECGTADNGCGGELFCGNCDDGDNCTRDICNDNNECENPLEEGADCQGIETMECTELEEPPEGKCTVEDGCEDGKCEKGLVTCDAYCHWDYEDCGCLECVDAADCDDEDVCTRDICNDNNECENPLEEGADCQGIDTMECDGLQQCNEDPDCQDGECETGTVTCDGVDCVWDYEGCGCEGDADCDLDGVCDPDDGENCGNCIEDCPCDDGVWCNGQEICLGTVCSSKAPPCPPPLVCYEDRHECGLGGMFCGDGVGACDYPGENCRNCPQDCGPCPDDCGDDHCQAPYEWCTCAEDCGDDACAGQGGSHWCNDGRCDWDCVPPEHCAPVEEYCYDDCGECP